MTSCKFEEFLKTIMATDLHCFQEKGVLVAWRKKAILLEEDDIILRDPLADDKQDLVLLETHGFTF